MKRCRGLFTTWVRSNKRGAHNLLKPQEYSRVRGEGYDDIPDNIKVEIRL